MPTPTFPTHDYSFVEELREALASDPLLRSEAEDGKILTRPRVTGALYSWEYSLRMFTAAMWATLRAFEKTLSYGSVAFIWTHPFTELTYLVKFKEPLAAEQEGTTDYYKITVKLVEAAPNSEGAV